jgi:hypothetical protein
MPCGAGSQLPLFQNNNIRVPQLCQVIGRIHTDRTAADDHGLGMGWHCVGHGGFFRISGVAPCDISAGWINQLIEWPFSGRG